MSSFHIDQEIRSFIDRTNAFQVEGNAPDIHRVRDGYNEMCRAFACPYPVGITSADSITVHGDNRIGLRCYTGSGQGQDVAIVYYHGGGFVVGNLDSHDSVCAEICAITGIPVWSVDYRLAPEYKHPCQFQDALHAFHYLAAIYQRLVVVGDSAGGTLAAAVCHATRGQCSQPVGQVLIYPYLGGENLQLASYRDNAEAPLLSRDDLTFYTDAYQDKSASGNDPTLYPLMATDFDGLPPCYAFSADIDPVRDDAGAYVRALKNADIPATWINTPGLVHGYLRARHCSEKANNAFRSICDAISALLAVP